MTQPPTWPKNKQRSFVMKGLKIFIVSVLLFLTGEAFASQAPPQGQPQSQPSSLALRLNDVFRMMLESNLSVAVARRSPHAAQSATGTYLQPFQPTLHVHGAAKTGA